MARCPKTAEEAFKILDNKLSEEDKKAIREAEDVGMFHFSLGMWIRNAWIHTGDPRDLKSLMKDLGKELIDFTDYLPKDVAGEDPDPLLFMHPDSISSSILEAYQKHLKELDK